MTNPKIVCCVCGKECGIFSPLCKSCEAVSSGIPEPKAPTPQELEQAGQARLIP
jgi:hypothetical protein